METIEIISMLEDRFRERSVYSHMFLLSPSDAREFLDAGKDFGLRFVGVTGFSPMATGGHQENHEWGNDIADVPHLTQDEFEAHTLELLRRGEAAGVVFEVVFDAGNPPLS